MQFLSLILHSEDVWVFGVLFNPKRAYINNRIYIEKLSLSCAGPTEG